MKNIAYKVSQGNPNLPDGFVTDHFETDETAIEGYSIIPQAAFQTVLDNNIFLYRNFEKGNGIVTSDKVTVPTPIKPDSEAQLPSPESIAATQKALKEQADSAALFQQFLAWKASQSSNS